MNRYHLVHITEFHYDGPVSESYNEVRLRPMTDDKQSCLSFRLTTIRPRSRSSYQDAFGNWVTPVQRAEGASPAEDRNRLGGAPAGCSRDWRRRRRWSRWTRAQEELHDEFYDYMVPSNYVPLLDELDELVAAAEGNSGGTALGFAEAASQLIHERFQYVKGATHVHSSIEDALRVGAGVCQDFAHLLLGVLRKRGLPARYVSGYLVPKQAENPSLRDGRSDRRTCFAMRGRRCTFRECGWIGPGPDAGHWPWERGTCASPMGATMAMWLRCAACTTDMRDNG